jgi:hypothetical protein
VSRREQALFWGGYALGLVCGVAVAMVWFA